MEEIREIRERRRRLFLGFFPLGHPRRRQQTRQEDQTRQNNKKADCRKMESYDSPGIPETGGKTSDIPGLPFGGGDGVGVGGVMSRNDELVSNWILMSA